MTTLKLRIVCDHSSESPREWDNLGTIAYKHRNYKLGEEQIEDPIEWLENKMGIEPSYEYNQERLEQLENKFFEEYIGHEVYAYEHSDIRLNTRGFSCPWDSGKVGYIYVDKETVREEFGKKRISNKLRKQVLDILDGEIKLFSTYLSEGAYGFIIEDENGESVDSCYGFIGTDHDESGLKCHLPEELRDKVNEVEIEYSY